MKTQIDTSRLPSGEMAYRTLIDALRYSDDRQERHYLEVKSCIDFETKVGFAKVAKFILGAANRMPDQAERHFEGHALLALGVGRGVLPGIAAVEVMDIQRGLLPYLTAKGPRWDLQRIPVDGNRDVLVVIVDPPHWGDDFYLCHKAYQPDRSEGQPGKAAMVNGGIYLRAEGESRFATALEIEQLRERGRRSTPKVDLDVRIEGSAGAYTCEEQVLNEYLRSERERALTNWREKSRAPTQGDARALLLANLVLGNQNRVRTTQADVERGISAWQDRFRAKWPRSLDAVAGAYWPGLRIVITNNAPSYLKNVQVIIRFERGVEGLEKTTAEDLDFDEWFPPAIPRPRDPYPMSIPDLSRIRLRRPYPVEFKNEDGSLVITINLEDVRPGTPWKSDDDDIVLVLRDPSLASARGTWRATAEGHGDVFSGDLTVPVAELVNFGPPIKELLSEDTKRPMSSVSEDES